MKAIAAMSLNRAIGKNNGLPWPSVKEDFKWFKEFTMNQNLVVGNSTFNTLPPLKDRNIYFLHRPQSDDPNSIPTGDYGLYKNKYGTVGKRLWYVHEVVNGIVSVDMLGNETIWKLENPIIAGGAKTYELFLPYITEFYITHINGIYEGDVFMPVFTHMFNKQEVIKEFDGGHKVVTYSK